MSGLLSSSSTTGSTRSAPFTRSSKLALPAHASSASASSPVVAEPREPVAELGGERVVDVEPLVLGRRAEDGVVRLVQAPQLVERPLVVVDAYVDRTSERPA